MAGKPATVEFSFIFFVTPLLAATTTLSPILIGAIIVEFDPTKEFFPIFVLFFPQLIAGPIIRFSEVNKQYIDKFRKKINYINVSRGLLFFFIGLFKKVIIADTLSEWVNDGFNNSENLNFIEA